MSLIYIILYKNEYTKINGQTNPNKKKRINIEVRVVVTRGNGRLWRVKWVKKSTTW